MPVGGLRPGAQDDESADSEYASPSSPSLLPFLIVWLALGRVMSQ